MRIYILWLGPIVGDPYHSGWRQTLDYNSIAYALAGVDRIRSMGYPAHVVVQ